MKFRLKACLEKIIDNRGKNPIYFKKEKYPVIDNVCIKNNYYINEKEVNRYINEDTYINFLRGYVEKDMPIMTLVGSGIGKVALIKNKNVAIVQNTIGFKTNDRLNSKYLYYWFLTKQKELQLFNRGSGQPSIKKTDVEEMLLDIPCIDIQNKIVNILSKIDDKIELNNQTNDNLYELGDALYKEYYSKYENELPNGYKYLDLNEVSVNFDSKRKPMSSREREQHKGIYPYYGATSIIDYVDDYIFDDTYLLMGEDGTVKTNEGYPVLQYIWGKSCINNHTHVLQGTIISTEHLMFALRKKNIETLITGAVQPKINQENMNKIKIIIATDDINIKFEEQIKIIVDKIKFNSIENITLTQLRNTLLPKLMNGKIDLNKIEV